MEITGRHLAVLMPVYNEAGTVAEVLRRVLEQPAVAEVVVVDDGSTDATRGEVGRMAAEDKRIRLLAHEHNRGKGAALRTGIAALTAPVTVIQDADLEYDPSETTRLLPLPWKPTVRQLLLVSRVFALRTVSVLESAPGSYPTKVLS